MLEENIGRLLRDNEGTIIDHKFASLMRLNDNIIRGNFNVVVCELELLFGHLYVVVCGVFNWDSCL